jgi:DNA-binding Xre family transcriptional regulator
MHSDGENDMLTLDDIKRLLADRRLDIVSSATGVHRNTLAAIRDGKNDNPTLRTLQSLSDYFTGSGAQ